jgi:plasmid replication initiation protein
MAIRQLTLPGEIVKKSNAIVRARWQPESKWEPRIVALVASKVRESDEDFFTYRIPVSELTGLSDENLSGEQYREIAKSIERLGKSTIHIAGKNPRNFVIYTIFAKCGYEDGYLIAGFHPDLKPHFLHLQGHFTKFSLLQYLNLPSIYSQKIFEYLKSWESESEITISVAELHDILNTPESFKKNFTEFRRWVLVKAYKDIRSKTRLRYEWEAIKKGRSYISVRFIFNKKIIEQKEKEQLITQNKSQSSNFVTAVACAKEKKGKCTKQNNKKSVCAYCKQHDILGTI